MNHPGELTLQDVRCFQGEQRGSLRPITLLVGENSTGKTTFLGCYHVLHRLLSGLDFERMLDFNEEPFAMGSFRDIVRSGRRPGAGSNEFKPGVSFDPPNVTRCRIACWSPSRKKAPSRSCPLCTFISREIRM